MAYNRREFLKTTTVLGSGLALAGVTGNLLGCAAARNRVGNDIHVFGIQLYTLRNEMPKDPKGILQQLASYGYKQIEGYEGEQGLFWGMSNTEFKKYLDGLDLNYVSSHCDINNNFERKAGEAAAIGMKYLISPYIGPQKTIDDYKRYADRFNQLGEICRKAGLKFAYHNHGYTFETLNGVYPQDTLMQHTDPALVDYQMDIYWVVTPGQDPVQWLQKYPNRWRLCHVKDRIAGAPASEHDASTTLGTGSINFSRVLYEARKAGMRYYIVEQERYDNTTPLNAARDNATYLKNLKLSSANA